MNRRPSGLKLSAAILGFQQYKMAEALSPTTLTSYKHDLELWLSRIGDVQIDRITSQDVLAHLAWLRTEYKPRRFSGDEHALSPKSIRNTYATLSAFFAWAAAQFNMTNVMEKVPAPHFKKPVIEPFKQDEIERLLKACEFCKEANTNVRKKFTMRRPTGRRDRAVILFLLDSGLRASELCSLRIADVDQRTGHVEVRHGDRGGTKGGKGRTVFIGKATRNALWRYLVEREDHDDPNAALFMAKRRPLNKNALRQMTVKLARKANVNKCYPHRFRHTFAITYLRCGGDLFTLQALLGHTTLAMVQHYARIAEVDIEQAHRRASPADNWHL